MGNQGKGKGAWGGSAKSSSSKAAGAKRVSNQSKRGANTFKSQPHNGGSISNSGSGKPRR